VTVTEATGTGGGGVAAVTVSAAWPVLPSLIATMLALPAAVAVTSPVAFTVATLVFVLDQVTVRPVSTAPVASFVTALACVVCPTVRLPFASVVVTLATAAGGGGGAVATVSAAWPLTPSLEAKTVADPAATPDTNPFADTVATELFDVLHDMLRPVSAAPAASRATAESCTVVPTCTLAAEGVTDTAATGTGTTTTGAVADFPSTETRMLALPTLRADSIPALET
jgi:hypothetical protein